MGSRRCCTTGVTTDVSKGGDVICATYGAKYLSHWIDEPANTDEDIFGENTACFFSRTQMSGDCGAKRLGEGGTGELGAVVKGVSGDKNGEDTSGDVGGDKWTIYERSGSGDGAPVKEER